MADTPQPKRKHKTEKPPLSAQDIRFARLLFDRGKKTVAECYLEAGFPPGPTPNATTVAAHRAVRNRNFREFYRQLQDRAADAAQVDANMIVQGLKRIATADRGDLYDDHGCLLPHDEWPADVAATVEGVESEDLFEIVSEKGNPRRKELRGYLRKVKTARRTEAYKLLAQILRMIGNDSEQGKDKAPSKPNANAIVVEIGPDHVEPPPEESF